MNSNQKQSIPPTGNGLLRKARIRTCFFSEWLVRPQPYAVHSVSAYIPCWSRFSLNTKRVCFSNAFEAHSAIARANVRQEEKVPTAQVAACSTGGQQSGSGLQRPQPPNMQECAYLSTASALSGNTTWRMKELRQLQTYPSWNGSAAAGPHNGPFKLTPWSRPLPLHSADCTAHP